MTQANFCDEFLKAVQQYKIKFGYNPSRISVSQSFQTKLYELNAYNMVVDNTTFALSKIDVPHVIPKCNNGTLPYFALYCADGDKTGVMYYDTAGNVKICNTKPTKNLVWVNPVSSYDQLPPIISTENEYYASMYVGHDDDSYGMCYIFDCEVWGKEPRNLATVYEHAIFVTEKPVILEPLFGDTFPNNPELGQIFQKDNHFTSNEDTVYVCTKPGEFKLVEPRIYDWETLARRLLGAMYYGFRIEPDSGHRYIVIDADADNLPQLIKNRISIRGELDRPCEYLKEYGSVVSALDKIDTMLVEANAKPTLEAYDNFILYEIDNYDTVFGTGAVE